MDIKELEPILTSFLTRIENKLESLLYISERLMKENIKLRKELDNMPRCNIESDNTAITHECSHICGLEEFSGKKKILVESVANGELKFYGNGTFDAKEIIKTFGDARFDKPTKSWVLTPGVTMQFIQDELSKEFDYQFLQ